jgi:pimeloyl-ACP methyl ester carboxylesterase
MKTMEKLEIIERHPTEKSQPTSILFVHGAWHGAWCWDEFFLPYFAERGFHVKALSLRGHGGSAGRERLRTWRVADYVQDVASIVRSFPQPPILVGHSMGGLIVQKYLELTGEPPIPKAFLLGSIPPYGVWKTALQILARQPLVFLMINLTWKLYPLVATVERMQHVFFSADMPGEQLEKYFARMQNESYLAFMDMLLLSLPKPERVKTPVWVLGAANDTVISIADVEATARAYRTQARLFGGMAHDMMLEKDWQKVADHIIDTIGENQ